MIYVFGKSVSEVIESERHLTLRSKKSRFFKAIYLSLLYLFFVHLKEFYQGFDLIIGHCSFNLIIVWNIYLCILFGIYQVGIYVLYLTQHSDIFSYIFSTVWARMLKGLNDVSLKSLPRCSQSQIRFIFL